MERQLSTSTLKEMFLAIKLVSWPQPIVWGPGCISFANGWYIPERIPSMSRTCAEYTRSPANIVVQDQYWPSIPLSTGPLPASGIGAVQFCTLA